jgi:hypothetical protein
MSMRQLVNYQRIFYTMFLPHIREFVAKIDSFLPCLANFIDAKI